MKGIKCAQSIFTQYAPSSRPGAVGGLNGSLAGSMLGGLGAPGGGDRESVRSGIAGTIIHEAGEDYDRTHAFRLTSV